MATKDILKEAEKYSEAIALLIGAFGSREGTKALVADLNRFPVEVSPLTCLAYRYIFLSEGLEDEGFDGWKKAQLNWSQIEEPAQSWAKTLKAAEYYSSKHKEGAYRVLVKATIRGVELESLCAQVLAGVRELNEALRQRSVADFFTLQSLVKVLEKQIEQFGQEEEIISLTVLDFEFLPSSQY